MKKQKNYYKKFWIIGLLALISAITYASWGLKKQLPNSVATSPWSNNSIQEFTPSWTEWTSYATFYVNKDNNSSIIWNFLSWYYYDSVYWFFRLDWDSPWSTKNVRIVDSTDKCPWYWYKLWWYAYSDNFWFVDFSYDENIFVYYCIDKTIPEWWYLDWYAYLENVWFQNFKWIKFSIKPEVTSDSDVVNDDNFVNDNTEITKPDFENDSDVINWNIQYLNDRKWSIFYIIK